MRHSAIFLLGLSLAACTAPATPHGHSADKCVGCDGPNHVNGAMETPLWIDMTEEEFRRVSVKPPFPYGPVPEVGDRGYPLVEWLQSVSDVAFERVRARYLEENPGSEFLIPRPRVRVVPAKDANGWVAGVPVCLGAAARIDAGSADRTPREAAQILLFGDRLSDRMPGRSFGRPDEPCLTADWTTDIGAYVDFFNSLETACQLSWDSGELVIGGDTCRYRGATTHAADVIVLSQAPFLNITSEMIAISEDPGAVLATLFHELGHYLQSHALSGIGSARYDYWYEQPEVPADEHPGPAADSERIAAQLEALAPRPMPSVPGQVHSPRLTRFLVDAVGRRLLPDMCETGCACQGALDAVDYEWSSDFSCIKCNYVPAATEDAYLTYERQLDACASNIRISNVTGPNTITVEDLAYQLGRVPSPPVGDVSQASTLAEVIELLAAAAKPLDEELDALREEIASRHLGQYTAEQHADDISADLWALVGREPLGRVEAAHTLTQVRHDMDPHAFVRKNGITWDAFDALYQRGWRDADGSYVFIGLGSLHDMHHGMPYRVFNLSREVMGHGYEAGPSAGLPAVDWAAMVALAIALRDEVPPPRPFSPQPVDPNDVRVVDGPPPLIID